jgi:hypothetical protein
MDQDSSITPRSESPEDEHTSLLNHQSNQRMKSHQTKDFPTDADLDDNSESSPKQVSVYLSGVSRTSFWLIFVGILAQYFVSCVFS